ncbi:MAG: MBL fold metallo-hydrolase [Deltaproteobacteria bacterium]|nr:MAG: MBL fold metallo-hydrolase [Deltaproteobacteria bacterium]
MVQSPIETDALIIDWREVGPFAANSYLVVCKATKEAVLIDGCDRAPTLQAMINKHDANLKYLLQTHAHLDHVAALPELKELWPDAPIVLHRDEKMLYDNVEQQCRMFGLPPFPPPPPVDQWMEDGEEIAFGELKAKAYLTPGHSPGSLTFQIAEKYLFAGDVLFAGSIGRTDLPGGSMKVLLGSIKRLLREVGDGQVFPGHGPPTTLSHEEKYNPFLDRL